MEQQLVRVNVRRPPEPRQIILPTAQSKDTVTVPPALSALGSSMTALNDLPAEVWVVRPDFGVSETEELRNKLLGIRDSTTGRAVFADHNAEPKRPNIGRTTVQDGAPEKDAGAAT